MTRLIVNADDVGLNAAVNEATVDFVERGLVTSVTLMANGRARDDAISMLARLRRRPSVGVHLNVFDHYPVGDGRGLEVLRGADGQFNGRVLDARIGPALGAAIAREWCAQVDAVRLAGIEVSHLDSHLHVHTRAALFPALKTVQRRCAIRRVRLTKNLYSTASPPASAALAAAKTVWNTAVRVIYATRTTDAFTEFATFLELVGAGRTLPASLEVMVHPGSPADVAESRALAGGWLTALDGRVRLVTYDDI